MTISACDLRCAGRSDATGRNLKGGFHDKKNKSDNQVLPFSYTNIRLESSTPVGSENNPIFAGAASQQQTSSSWKSKLFPRRYSDGASSGGDSSNGLTEPAAGTGSGGGSSSDGSESSSGTKNPFETVDAFGDSSQDAQALKERKALLLELLEKTDEDLIAVSGGQKDEGISN